MSMLAETVPVDVPRIDISIVVVTSNRKPQVLCCLESVFRSEAGGKTAFEVVLVDNGSTDGTSEAVQERFPDVRIVASSTNLGVGPGRNAGISRSVGRYVFLLDDDTTFTQSASLEGIVRFLDRRPDVGLLGPKLVDREGGTQESCRRSTGILTILGRRTFMGSLFPRIVDRHLMRDYDHAHVREVDWVQGAAQVIPRQMFERYGSLKEWFYGYEDEEFCLRLRRRGLKVVYFPQVAIVHDYQRLSAKGVNRYALHQVLSFARFYVGRRLG